MQAMYDSLKAVWQELTSEGGAFEIEEITVRGAPMRTFKAAPNHLVTFGRAPPFMVTGPTLSSMMR